jgi:pimeloyl-ACP methyl ester carboxylesterase
VRLETARADLTRGSLILDGRTWRYWERAGERPPLVMIHGYGASSETFVRFAGQLDGWPVLAVDLPGFGASDDANDGDYHIGAQAARLHAFLAAKGVKRYHLVGNSMGGAIAARLAHDHPDEVVTLLLLEPFGLGNLPPSERDRLLEKGDNVLAPDTPAEFDRMLDMVMAERPFIPGPLLAVQRARYFARVSMLNDIFAQVRSDTGFLDALLPGIQAPTLVIWGDSNKIFDLSGAERIAAGVPHGRAVILPRCGHVPMLEKPIDTASEYRKLLGEL